MRAGDAVPAVTPATPFSDLMREMSAKGLGAAAVVDGERRVLGIFTDGDLRRKIEARGTRDFPQVKGKKLYGELTMNVTVDNQGHVVDAEIIRPSSQRALDQRAVAIVRAASPFGDFSADMRRQADQIVITSRFRFTREEGLETSLSNAQ